MSRDPRDSSGRNALITALALALSVASLVLEVIDDPSWAVRGAILATIPLVITIVAAWHHGYRAGRASERERHRRAGSTLSRM